MSSIVPTDHCTACNLCTSVCPKNCVSLKRKSDGTLVAEKDDAVCINCGLCEKLCPSLSAPAYNQVREAYAAWSKDEEVFRNSASGGIAAEIYKMALSEGWGIVGCKLDTDLVARYYLTENVDEIRAFQNSKYVQSVPGGIYQKVKEVALSGKKVLFIGLPCHVAAMDNYSRKYGFKEMVLLVDLVCHGTAPSEYLTSHIDTISKQRGVSVDTCFFRDPRWGSHEYIFSLYLSGKLIYKNPTRRDLYTFGFHHALIYRDCCYDCHYAKRERVGDLTICDYSGLGTRASWEHKERNISCILVNSDKGNQALKRLGGKLHLYTRPIDEPLDADMLFNHPCAKKLQVAIFKELYGKEQDYDKAAEIVFRPLIKAGLRQYYNPVNRIRPLITKLVPTSARELIKRIFER